MPLSAQSVQIIKSVLDGATKEGPTGVNGLTFVAVDKDGKTLVEHASGTRGVNSQEPMDMDTTFWIASCTKIVATIAVLQLVEQGSIPLDDPEFIKKLAPEIGAKKVYADGVNGAEQQGSVTMRMLLNHTAGFAYAFFDARVSMRGRPVGIAEFNGDEEDILNSPMVNQPGSMWEYGVNIDWAGIILERHTGQKLNDYMQEHIFKPLGISDVTMFPTDKMKANLAYMHQRDPATGALTERDHLYRRPFYQTTKEQQQKFFHSAGAGLFAKPKEYVKVLTALLNDGVSPTTGNRILKKETVDLMWENQIPKQPDFARAGLAAADPTLANSLPEMYPQSGNPPQGWGLSMFLTLAPGDTGRGANTGWWCGLSNLFWWVDREKGVAGMLSGQILPFGDPKVIQAWVGVEKAIYDGLE
ncbi:beta-lactamase/transpeptidase-like protein [Paraphaeosphaeria sporulosa]|uniref:Beta-lactamase/transpeptidase-like protein n=1 Tax=Paraphaeosphaeria sporulosa TaxID=1460663 RepID=A0A177CH00_9PLEO|nr:beta-lactamase/transpeptidase-like protein [Paraphaeosphaeria sporulosa]OAG06845.1 beta-lactamase/transpeptidase-like protein [Paraphaeosphaeria sporulosa]